MKFVSTNCPSCGAQLEVDLEAGKAHCPACGGVFIVDDETQHVSYDGAEDAGYRFEMGRRRAQEEARRQAEASPSRGVPDLSSYVPERLKTQEGSQQPKKRNTLLWILGWVFYFPLPLSVLVKRWYDGDPDVKIDAVYVIKSFFWFVLWLYAWMLVFPLPLFFLMKKRGVPEDKIKRNMIVASVVYVLYLVLIIARPFKGSSDSAPVESASSEVVQAAEGDADAAESAPDEAETDESVEDKAATDAVEEAKSPEETVETTEAVEANSAEKADSASEALLLKAGELGEYGSLIPIYGGGSEDDIGVRLAWFVPEGVYTVSNLDNSKGWEQVNYGNPEPTLNSDGVNESMGFTAVLVKPGEPVEIEIPPGGCLYITGDTGALLLEKH